jgi:hypothetical protein
MNAIAAAETQQARYEGRPSLQAGDGFDRRQESRPRRKRWLRPSAAQRQQHDERRLHRGLH